MAERQLTIDDLEIAAFERFANGLTWERAAKQVGCTRRCLHNWRKKPEWETAKGRVLTLLRQDASETGWGCLMRQAQRGDVSAAKELLARAEGPVPTKLTGTGTDGAIALEHSWWEGVAQIEQEEANGGDTAAGPEGAAPES